MTFHIPVVFEDLHNYEKFYCVLTIITPKFLPNRIGDRENAFLLPKFPLIMVSDLQQNIIEIAIEAFINSINSKEAIVPSNLIPHFNKNAIEKILYQNKKKWIRFNEKLKAKLKDDLEDESDDESDIID